MLMNVFTPPETGSTYRGAITGGIERLERSYALALLKHSQRWLFEAVTSIVVIRRKVGI